VEAVLEEYPGIPVYGPVETKHLADHIVKDGDTFTLLNETFKVMKTAGHSYEHISYLTEGALFCGDALFSGGCGRVFTGDYEAQYEALKKFRQLDEETLVYAGHEYTQTNLKFAQSVHPDNQIIKDELKEVEELREQDKPTLPSTIEKEIAINLFLKAETLEDFISLRKARDNF
jgi:hydroxyacylglutathione hydrolase